MPTIAIVGASSDRAKFGNKAVRAYLQQGYTVYPVNPKGGEIEGLTAFNSIAELPPGRLDRVSIYLPPAAGLAAVEELAGLDIAEVFFNPGADDEQVVARARELGLNAVVGCSLLAVGVDPN